MAEIIVSSGVISSGLTLKNDSMYVQSGGTAADTIVTQKGQLHLSGGAANDTTVNDYGQLHLSGGVANDTTVVGNGKMYVSGGVASNVAVRSDATLYVSNGVVSNATIYPGGFMASCGTMYVSDGGVAVDTVVESGADLRICSGGVASNTIANGKWTYHDGLLVSSGGTLINTTLNSYIRLDVLDGVSAINTTVNSTASMTISSGGVALAIKENGGYVDFQEGAKVSFVPNTISGLILDSSDISVHSGTVALDTRLCYHLMTVFQSGVASNIDVDTGTLSISGGGVASDIDIYAKGVLTIASNGEANDIILRDGSVRDYGTANNAVIVSGGAMNIYHGGVANDTVLSQGILRISGGGVANDTIAYCYSGLHGSMFISGGTGNRTFLGDACSMRICNGGVANDTLVSSGGEMIVSTYGSANNTVVVGGFCSTMFGGYQVLGYMSVNANATASNTTVSSGGNMTIYSAGMANGITVNSGGGLAIYSGGLGLAIKENGGYVAIQDGAGATFVANTFSGVTLSGAPISIHSGTTAVDTVANGKSHLYVFNGGVMNNTTIDSQCFVDVYYGGVMNNTVINGVTTTFDVGSMNVYGGGAAHHIVLNNGGMLFVHAGSEITDVTLNSGSVLSLSSGVAASEVLVNSGGVLNVSNGGFGLEIKENGGCVKVQDGAWASFAANTFSGVTISSSTYFWPTTIHSGTVALDTTISCGVMNVYNGGTAINTKFSGYGNLYVFNGGVASKTAVTSSVYLIVSEGGAATDTIVSGYAASMFISSGATASNTAISSGGRMTIFSTGSHSGTLNIGNGATVSAYQGAVIDFTVSGQSAPGTALLNDWSLISGGNDAVYTITVAANQRQGTYVLAGGASAFDQIITVKNTDGVMLGTLAVNEEKVLGNQTYSLTRNADTLTLTVVGTSGLKPAISDYNKSGRSDMVQFVNGFVYVTHDSGSGYVQTPAVNYIPPDAWNVVEIRRDLTGDGYADIQITSDDGYGSTWVATLRNDYLQTGCITLNYQFIGAYDNQQWSYLGSADVNNDGKSEVLMIQTHEGKDPYGNRNVAAWITDETGTWVGNTWVGSITDEWSVAGTADLTGDGEDNVLLCRNDGMIAYWRTAGTNDVVQLQNAGYRSMVSTGDFDGDGADDFLWQSTLNGELSTWTDVDGTLTDTVIGKASDLGGNWTFAGVGDYNADGKAELLWCDTVNYHTAYGGANKENFTNLVALS